MLPPVLEVYVVWHPDDTQGEARAETILMHFHGTLFTGLIGGAIEVFMRSAGWRSAHDSPRPIPFTEGDLPGGMQLSAFVAIVPVMGTEMASAVEEEGSAWAKYVDDIAAAGAKWPDRIAIFPYQLDEGVLNGTKLGEQLGTLQRIAASVPEAGGETEASLICRDLSQGIAQHLSPETHDRLTVFISHTKRARPGDEEDTQGIVDLVRHVIARTRLGEYFDASDLQPGRNWDDELRENAAQSALLAVRTDLYPTREWCQREVRIAKQSGMPIVFIDAPGPGEERGSFLMDHVARVPVSKIRGRWGKKDIYRALNLLVDECLKRVVWLHQEQLARAADEIAVSWWAPHAPEPVTVLHWLATQRAAKLWPIDDQDLIILHPDPPLGPDEKIVLDQILEVAGVNGKLDIMTPRLLAARGG